MRSFIVLCLIAVACADKLGYNYQPVDHSDAGLSFTPGSDAGALFGGKTGGNIGSAPGNDRSSYGSPSSGSHSHEAAPAGEIEKEFFTFSANDDDFNDPAEAQRVASAQKQSLRVIFIKGPENNGLENAALNLAKQAAEQKTAIYVLHKQADIGDLANKLNALRNTNSNKPEVHFVKYRTPEDAANAQQQIQAQYDGLGGQSQSHNGGVAPVINFASAAPVRAQAPAQAPGAAYLPTNIFRRRF